MARSTNLAVAESLTGGMLTGCFAAGPEASKWLRGGIVAYDSSVKHRVLGVSGGPVVSERAALEMARGAAVLFEADTAIAVTGAGGPDGQDGQPPGTVWFALTSPRGEWSKVAHFQGNPESICEQACREAVSMVVSSFAGRPT
jgi:nicotinamide-nucleotide amidase